MDKIEFDLEINRQKDKLSQIRDLAHGVHDGVNQKYDKTHPYWFHLDMVADIVKQYGWDICQRPEDVVPILFGAYFHDSIEDARLTYNDVMSMARGFLDEEGAFMATEIVYALTNEKGRNRAERANERYYQGIRSTPYAPMVKLADRLANYTHSCRKQNASNGAMKLVYQSEMPHFLSAIGADAIPEDRRMALPHEMLDALKNL